MPLGALKRLIERPETRELDLESSEATRIHRRLIAKEPFLRKLYERYYREFTAAHAAAPPGTARVEIGAGGGFLDELISGLVRVDPRPGARVEIVASADALPFRRGSVGAVFMLNVLHHLPDAARFFADLSRVLADGGRCVMIEPFVSPLSRLVYRHLHHEPFDPARRDWTVERGGPMTAADDALPWVVFVRDRARFAREFPRLEIASVRPHTIALYLLSGGLSYRSLAPAAAFEAIARLEDLVGRVTSVAASMMTVTLKARAAR